MSRANNINVSFQPHMKPHTVKHVLNKSSWPLDRWGWYCALNYMRAAVHWKQVWTCVCRVQVQKVTGKKATVPQRPERSQSLPPSQGEGETSKSGRERKTEKTETVTEQTKNSANSAGRRAERQRVKVQDEHQERLKQQRVIFKWKLLEQKLLSD